MKPFLSLARRFATICVFTGALVGVFTTVPAQAATQSACSTWLRFVDVSSNNPHPIDWSKAVKGGIAGAYIKNTEATNYVNPYFTRDAQGATKAGVPYGVYHFAQPGKADPVASAKFFLANGGNNGQFPPALDLEVSKLSPEATARWALLWLQTFEQISGRRPILYVGYYFPASQYPFLAPYDLWLPAYPNGYKPVGNVCTLPSPKIPAPWQNTGWKLWQFTSVGHPSGVGGNVDVSVVESAWFSKWTGAGYQPTTPNKPAAVLYSTGSHGTKVLQIQTLLISQELLPRGAADGIFGLQTKHALEVYQQRIGIKGDGVWSVDTQTASDFFLKHHYTISQDTQWRAMGATLKAAEWKVVL